MQLKVDKRGKLKVSEADIERTCTELSGRRFGRLLVQSKSPRRDGKNTFWLCVCDCDNVTEVTTTRLRSGHTSSCGCLRDEARTLRAMSRRSEYKRERRIWYGMIKRCHDPKSGAFKWYGARGINVCSRWRDSFSAFVADMGLSNGRQIDRLDNDIGYNPRNCHWTDSQTNNSNRRSNRLVAHDGITMTVMQWARLTGIKRWTIARRLDAGFTPRQIFG